MFNKKLLIILALLFSILLIVSSVSAEEVLNEDNNEEVNGLIDSQLSIEDNSLNVNVDDINSDESDNTQNLKINCLTLLLLIMEITFPFKMLLFVIMKM